MWPTLPWSCKVKLLMTNCPDGDTEIGWWCFPSKGLLITGKIRFHFNAVLHNSQHFSLKSADVLDEPSLLPQSVPVTSDGKTTPAHSHPLELWDLTPVSAVQIFSAPGTGPGPDSKLDFSAQLSVGRGWCWCCRALCVFWKWIRCQSRSKQKQEACRRHPMR